MNVATPAIVAAALITPLLAALLSPAFAAPHHNTTYRPYGYRAHMPVRITVYPARVDYSRYINPWNGMFCHDTGWATTCVPPPGGAQGVDCTAAWPFPSCRYF
ncbi:MAG: hypothetical protein WBE48_25295 [Xanthobacteraceae bacterium]|jgi:hypothetical protein